MTAIQSLLHEAAVPKKLSHEEWDRQLREVLNELPFFINAEILADHFRLFRLLAERGRDLVAYPHVLHFISAADEPKRVAEEDTVELSRQISAMHTIYSDANGFWRNHFGTHLNSKGLHEELARLATNGMAPIIITRGETPFSTFPAVGGKLKKLDDEELDVALCRCINSLPTPITPDEYASGLAVLLMMVYSDRAELAFVHFKRLMGEVLQPEKQRSLEKDRGVMRDLSATALESFRTGSEFWFALQNAKALKNTYIEIAEQGLAPEIIRQGRQNRVLQAAAKSAAKPAGKPLQLRLPKK